MEDVGGHLLIVEMEKFLWMMERKMSYINPYMGKDIPSSEEIRDVFEGFISISTGSEWYNMDYIKNEEPKRFIESARMNLEKAGYNIDLVFKNRKDLLEYLKANTDRVDFFRLILLDFYRFTQCPMDIFTVDIRHATALIALYKWNTGETVEVRVNSFFTLDYKNYFFVVENDANGSRNDEDCQYLYKVYKSVENAFKDAVSEEFNIRVDHLTQFMASSMPKKPWRRDGISNMIKMRIDHVAKCIEYTGDRRIISTTLFEAMNQLRIVIDRMDQIMGVFI